jgi:diguanylate cyclase (GGDEF)-like protein/PAS domain S-box-containing protein/excisionase family DNA binding protein
LVVAFDRRHGTLLSVAEAAAQAGVTPATIRAWCAGGRLPSVGIGPHGVRRIHQAELDRYLSERAAAGRPAGRAGAHPTRTGHVPARSKRGRRGLEVIREHVTRAEALRRIASEVSGKLDLSSVFDAVMDNAQALFGIARCGLWLVEPDDHPLRLVAQRDLSPGLIAAVGHIRRDARTAGMKAIRDRRIIVMTPRGAATAELRAAYREDGIVTICFVPIVFRDEPLGLLVLYHHAAHDWPSEELELARAFADQMAAAIANARLHEGVQSLAARLRAISDLASRLNRIQDVNGIGAAIVAETRTLIDFDTIRVYRVDDAMGACEPVAFQGRFLGLDDPTPEMLRVPIGLGLTGWVAANGQPIRTGDAGTDPRGRLIGSVTEGPESMLLVPMAYEDKVHGVIVVSKLGRDQFGVDDETTLSIFAGFAAQAMVNAANAERVSLQQAELEHQLASQRRLLEVSESLLSTLDPAGVLEMIADSLKALVPYDSMTIYKIDREAGVRRAVVARDRYAAVILDYAPPLNTGLAGWVIEHHEAALANDAHIDPRAAQIPGTPFEPESMIVVPLLVAGEAIGTLNLARMGGDESHYSQNEFELVKLFAGQASIALENAEAHRAVEVRAELDALTGLRNHGAFQRELGLAVSASGGSPFSVLLMDLDDFKAYNDSRGHPAGDMLLRSIAVAITGTVRDGDRVYRYGGDEFAVIVMGADRLSSLEVADRIRRAVDTASPPEQDPRVGISVGVACYPADGRTKDELVLAADRALYLLKPSRSGADPALDQARDAYVSALNETALALMDRLEPTELLQTIVQRAAALMGTPNGFLYVVKPDESALVVRVGTGFFKELIGYRTGRGQGVSGSVWETGQPMTVDDYDGFSGRRPDLPTGRFGAIVAVPLTAEGRVVGVLGLASGSLARTFGDDEVAVLGRFAQLASIALTNARLFQAAQHEVTERGRAEEALRISEERFRRLSDATTEAVLISRGGILLEVNQALGRLFGYEEADLIGRPVLDLVAPVSRALIDAQLANPSEDAYEVFALSGDGEVFPIEMMTRSIPYGSGELARVASIRDLRERRAMEERLTHQALYDGVTGLPNRVLLMDRVRHALSSGRTGTNAPISVILLDLDRFKVVNESLGHTAGDALLRDVAQRLDACVRPGDTVARFGGDEYAILLDDVDGPKDASLVAERIESELKTPFVIGGRDVFVTASMGIVVGQPGESDPEGMLRDAEIALYRAKADSAVGHTMFDPSMSAETVLRLDLESGLRWAIERHELRVFYQPLIDLATDRIVGLEALVRWQHPTRGLLPPLTFIPLAEETGLILPLGRWVLETACAQVRMWQLAFPTEPPVTISVNLSARQFAQADLVEQVAQILAKTGLPASSLELEITESVVMDESEAGIRALRALRSLGCRLALDDFGTGYSSLSYLKSLPLDTIKIDRSFVSGLGGEDSNMPIVQAVIGLAHGLGIDVTAEGIETAEQLGWLRELVCDRGQGYYYARPLPADELVELLKPDAPPISRASTTRLAIITRAGSPRARTPRSNARTPRAGTPGAGRRRSRIAG